MNEKQEKLIKLLEDMFQLNQTDLDFGIYRIMNQKADEIKQFLQKDLIASIKNAFSVNSNDGLQKELNDLISTITNAGMNPEDSPKVKEIREKLSSSSNNESTENEIYSYLTNFFSRYYKDGDFVSLRRYKKDTYAIPYEGEEVKLHWANSDQYYIKTSEFFRDYTFKVENKTYHFKIVEADTEKNNNKASDDNERRFVLDYDYPVYEENGELFIRFEYKSTGKELQSKLNEKAIEVILKEQNALIENLKTLSPTEKNKTRTILEKHLIDYTSRNSFDYFIHKDLKGFLSRELDFFIKNEILYIDDILDISSSQIENTLNKVKTFKTIANKIIAFLSQIEEFQKKLWLKKKFVIDANYCITLDRIDEKYYEEILNNSEQLKEWKKLFNVDVKNIEELRKEKFLVLDTKFFNIDFKNKLLSEFDDIDGECDGVLVNSDNFGALNLFQERYKEQIKMIYIDPPYNTDASEIIYKNGYKQSSWITLMYNRILLAKNLLDQTSILSCAIDDFELKELMAISDDIFGKENRLGLLSIEIKPSGRTNDNFMATSDEYYLFYSKDPMNTDINFFELTDNQTNQYSEEDDNGAFKWRDFLRTGGYSTPEERPNSFYPIYYDASSNEISLENKDGFVKILPVDSEGKYRVWRKTPPSFLEHVSKSEIKITQRKDGSFKVNLIDRIKSGTRPKSLWTGAKYDASSHGTKLLNNIIKDNPFSFPKSINAVKDILHVGTIENDGILMDFFAGSGTTGHATIKLNREDNGSRKYILVEMGNYFDTVTKPRIQKVIYSDNWKDGKPQDKVGISQMFKYFRLESYEDCLNNLAFKNTDVGLFDDNVKEDYLLNYMLDYETNESLLNIDAFKTPFDYKLKIATSSAGETVETNVDLVETFNYLIGLKVKTRVMNKGFLVIQGENLKEEKILVIWRDAKSNDELNAFFSKMDWTVYDREFDIIYVNGDNNLANLKKDEEHFKVKLIEEEFKARMFGE